MRKYLIITHGRMAYGMLDTLTMLIGEQDNLEAMSCYINGEPTNIIEYIQNNLNSLPDNSELIVFTDILGGSINNEAMLLLNDPRLHLITGINLATIIEILNGDSTISVCNLIEEVLPEGRQALIYCNTLNTNIEDEDF